MISKILAAYCILSYAVTTWLIYRGFKLQPELFNPMKPLMMLLFVFSPITLPFMIYGGIKQKFGR